MTIVLEYKVSLKVGDFKKFTFGFVKTIVML